MHQPNPSQNGHWKITSSEVKYENPWISVREDKVVQVDGKPGIFGIVTMMDGASVLATNSQGEVYLIKEYCYAIERDSIELISGGIDAGETPLEAAKRELKEEAGLTSHKWTDLGAIDPFTTLVDSTNHMFLAENVTEGERTLDSNEKLEIIKVPFDEVVAMALDGRITHGASVAGILKAKLTRLSFPS